MTTTVWANSTVNIKAPPQLSDAALGGIIGGAIAGLVLFLTVTVSAFYCVHRRKEVKLESPEGSVDPFTYVRQVNHRDGNWTLPPSSTLLFDPSTLPTSNSFIPGHVDRNVTTSDRLIHKEIVCDDPGRVPLSRQEVIAGSSTAAEIVVEKQTQTRNCRMSPEAEKFGEPEATSDTELRVELKPKVVTGTGFSDDMEPKSVSGTGLRGQLEPEEAVETGLRDSLSVNSLNPSLSEDYCNRVIDEAFLAIDNFAYGGYPSDTE